jgi:hypothetical protein
MVEEINGSRANVVPEKMFFHQICLSDVKERVSSTLIPLGAFLRSLTGAVDGGGGGQRSLFIFLDNPREKAAMSGLIAEKQLVGDFIFAV